MSDCIAFEQELEGIIDVEDNTEDDTRASEAEDDDDSTADVSAVPSPDMPESESDVEGTEWTEETLLKIQQEESGISANHYRVIERYSIFDRSKQKRKIPALG